MFLRLLRNNRPQHWAIVLLAVALFASPWLLDYRGEVKPEWNAWIFATGLAYLAFASLFEARLWEDWLALAFGVWLIVAPWVLGFSSNLHAVAVQPSVGALAILVPGGPLWQPHPPPHHLAS